jgi:hypothetical protein
MNFALSHRLLWARSGQSNKLTEFLLCSDKVPADLRLFRVKGLQVQEAALTAAFVFATNPHGK